MKKIKYITVALLLVFVSACSNYPTSGYIDLSKAKEEMGEDITLSNAQGVVFEIDARIQEDLIMFKKQIEDIYKIRDQKDYKPDLSYKITQQDKLLAAIAKFQEADKPIKDDLVDGFNNWHQVLLSQLRQSNEATKTLKQEQQQMDAYTAEAQENLDSIKKKIEDYENKQSEIIGKIMDRSNQEIVRQKIAVRKLKPNSFRLSYQVEDFNPSKRRNYRKKKVAQCESVKPEYDRRNRLMWKKFPVSDYIHFDNIKQQNICYYIKRPVKAIQSSDYDKFVIEQFKIYISKNTTKLREQKRQAEKKLKEAYIIAENQTGISYKAFNKKYNKQKELDNLYEKLLSDDFAIDTFITQDNKIDSIQQNKFDSNIGQLVRQLIRQKNNKESDVIRHAREQIDFPDPLDKWRKKSEKNDLFDKAVSAYKNQSLDVIIEKAIIEKTKFNEDGSFSGLDGSAGFVIPLVNFDISKEGEKKQTVSIKSFFDMTGEPNPYAKQSDLLINKDNSKLSRYLIKEKNYKEIIAQKINRYIRNKKLDR